ncbi:hypothetical protein ACROYT_G000672 [Oculina patagonica]
MVFRSHGSGVEDEEEDLAHDKIVFSPVGHRLPARRHAVVGRSHTQDLSQRPRVVVVQIVLLIDPIRVHATCDAVVLTARGRGTLGVHARVAEYRNKPERYVLHRTQVVEERRVREDAVKRKAVILECPYTSGGRVLNHAQVVLEKIGDQRR